jgi:hypothetical protein
MFRYVQFASLLLAGVLMRLYSTAGPRFEEQPHVR